MALGPGSLGLALLAGLLSTLSPCVLPILPILLGSALAAHARAPLALAAGLALSYAVIGTAIAWAGAAFGFDTASLRSVGAVLLVLLGLVLLSGALQQRFAVATAGLGDAGQRWLARLDPQGLRGQFIVGLMLGVVWSPCVGPTLGAAIVLASQGTQLAQAALVMALFGLGAALPVLLLGAVSRAAMLRLRGRLLQAGRAGKTVLGALMLAIGLLILSGLDKPLEAWLVQASPDWLTRLTTRF
ncbi:cytochrome c biogenesis CcdA family protein [Aquabacterium sp.]|uniref:cytochrome c biogenesis CcdA family protein n=1 Tax=Aquabacterium sp. TaxID=1872578 RepID=UPI00378443C1